MVSLRDALTAAVGHHRAGRPDEARGLYLSILDAVPDQPDALHLLGVLEGQGGRTAKALDLLERAVAVLPGDADFLGDLALTRRAAGQPDRAALAYSRALALDPRQPDAAYNLGNLLLAAGDGAGAAGRYRQAVTHRPVFPAAWNNLGTALLTLGRAGDAADSFAQAIRQQPDDAVARINRANALAALGNHAAAMRLRRQALILAPSQADALHNLAVRWLTEAGMDQPVVAGRPLDQGKLDKALTLLRRCLAVDPDHAAAGDALAGATLKLLLAGRADDALVEAAARTAPAILRHAPRDSRAAALIAYRLYRRGRTDLASRWMRRFARRFPATDQVEDFEIRSWSLVHAERGWLDRLPDIANLLSRLPPLEMLDEPPTGSGPVIVVSCDDVYFRRFAGDLLASVETAGGLPVHLHLIDPSPDTLAAVEAWRARLPLGVSLERMDFTGWDDHRRKTYYACIRFVRWHQLLERWRRPLAHLDADCTVAADLSALAPETSGYDVGLLRDRRGRGPTRDVTVCFAWYMPTAAGRRFLSLTAAYIAELLLAGRGYWMLDQAAPYCVLDRLQRDGQPPAVRWFDWMDFPWVRFIGEK